MRVKFWVNERKQNIIIKNIIIVMNGDVLLQKKKKVLNGDVAEKMSNIITVTTVNTLLLL